MKQVYIECNHLKYAVVLVFETGNIKDPLKSETLFFRSKREARDYIDRQINLFHVLYATIYKKDSTLNILFKSLTHWLWTN